MVIIGFQKRQDFLCHRSVTGHHLTGERHTSKMAVAFWGVLAKCLVVKGLTKFQLDLAATISYLLLEYLMLSVRSARASAIPMKEIEQRHTNKLKEI